MVQRGAKGSYRSCKAAGGSQGAPVANPVLGRTLSFGAPTLERKLPVPFVMERTRFTQLLWPKVRTHT